MARGKLAAISVATASVLGTVLVRRRRRMHQTRVDLYFGDGVDAVAARRCARDGGDPARRPRHPRGRHVTDLAARVREAAVLEGDFLLRSGRRSRFYVDKYRFGTRPDLLAEIGEALALRIAAVEPDATRIAAPEVGAIALAAAASLRSGLPFVIVRKAPKEYGTTKRLEGAFEPGERMVVVEDVVTSGGAAIDSVRALRDAGLVCETVSASSTARRAAPRRWRTRGSRCIACSTAPSLRVD